MAMLHGAFSLVIVGTHRKNKNTTRYKAKVKTGKKTAGDEVTVKFLNCGHSPDDFIGRTGNFDGDKNDIRDIGDRIDQCRKNEPFPNPFVKGNAD